MRRSCAFSKAAGALLVGSVALLAVSAKTSPLVEDEAELMRPAERAYLAEYHDYLLADHDIDYRVVTAVDVGDINIHAVRRFEELAAGARSSTGRGLLLLVDPAQDLVRLEVGYALEGVFPDGFVAYVEQRQMVPFFRAGRVADGILAASELIVARAQQAEANAGFDGAAWSAGSGGAGATAPAKLGAGGAAKFADGAADIPPGRTPGETLGAYLSAMAARNANPGLTLYTPATRDMLAGWVMTPAQMTTLVKTYRRCTAETARFGPRGRLAVIRYPVRERACAPWFFRKIAGAWALDLTMMQKSIRFGRTNAWHFDQDAEHPYGFAFADWRFDGKGFPVGRR